MIGTRTLQMRRAVERFLSLPGVSGNYARVADDPPLDITGDIDIRVRVALTDWTPSGAQGLIGKWGGSGAKSYILRVETTGSLGLFLSADGSAEGSATSSAAVGAADGATTWVRATWRNSDDRVQFFTSTDGSSWTQLGTDQSISATGIFSSASTLEVGSYGGSGLSAGKFYAAQVYSGIDGTLVLDIDFTRPRVGAITFTEDSPNHYLVTINQSGANPARILS